MYLNDSDQNFDLKIFRPNREPFSYEGVPTSRTPEVRCLMPRARRCHAAAIALSAVAVLCVWVPAAAAEGAKKKKSKPLTVVSGPRDTPILGAVPCPPACPPALLCGPIPQASGEGLTGTCERGQRAQLALAEIAELQSFVQHDSERTLLAFGQLITPPAVFRGRPRVHSLSHVQERVGASRDPPLAGVVPLEETPVRCAGAVGWQLCRRPIMAGEEREGDAVHELREVISRKVLRCAPRGQHLAPPRVRPRALRHAMRRTVAGAHKCGWLSGWPMI